jgi:polyphosphate kinase
VCDFGTLGVVFCCSQLVRTAIGTTDWMRRNLSDRVEAVTPVEVPALRGRLWEFLQIMLGDQRQAWDMQPDGTCVQRQPPEGATGPEALGTHQAMMELTCQQTG